MSRNDKPEGWQTLLVKECGPELDLGNRTKLMERAGEGLVGE